MDTIAKTSNVRRSRPISARRRGITSLLALIFMIVFGALALGFYAQTNMAVQVTNNERRMKEARAAAEAGLQYIRYELSRVTLDPLLTDAQVFEEMHMDLKAHIETLGANLEDGAAVSDIIYDADPTDGVDAPYFEIPAVAKQYIRLGTTQEGPWFRARFEQQGRDIVVTTIGKSANNVTSPLGNRAGIELRFRTKEWPNVVFSYGMASQNVVSITMPKLVIAGTPDSQASILSTYTLGTPVTIGNTSSTALLPTGIEGTITLMQGAPNPQFIGSNYSVGGVTTPAAINTSIQRITERPEWPTVDTSVFESYATTPWVSGRTLYENIYVPPNSNPTFDGSMIVRGVVLVHQPNMVNFQGGVQMCAVIVGKDNPAVVNDFTKNYIRFSGSGVSKLPLSALPSDSKFDGLRDLSGTFIVAPGFDVIFQGNFGAVAGSVAAERISITGNTSGSFTGTLLNLGNYPLTISGSSSIALSAPGEDKRPGLRFTERYAPVKASYKEIRPPREL